MAQSLKGPSLQREKTKPLRKTGRSPRWKLIRKPQTQPKLRQIRKKQKLVCRRRMSLTKSLRKLRKRQRLLCLKRMLSTNSLRQKKQSRQPLRTASRKWTQPQAPRQRLWRERLPLPRKRQKLPGRVPHPTKSALTSTAELWLTGTSPTRTCIQMEDRYLTGTASIFPRSIPIMKKRNPPLSGPATALTVGPR